MDSGNSGSMQSSSGGDDQEFDSRGESLSNFLNHSHNFTSIANNPQPPFLSHQNPNFFDQSHLSQNTLDHAAQYTNDNDLIWSRGLRSDHQSFSNLGNSSSLQSRNQSSLPAAPFPGPTSSDGLAPRAPPPQIKNPKKRTRASRRAPTTVLTTDTTNFRQMVQEFTGIPAAPFSGSPYSRRLDLFSAASALRAGGNLDSLGPLYPLRPAANKVLSPFSSSPNLLNSAMIDAITPTTTIGNTNNLGGGGASTSNNSSNFQLSADHLLNIQHHGGIHQQPSLQLGANSPMNFGNLSGFLSRETAPAASTVQVRNNNDDNLNRWKSGETVRNNDENLVGFDGNINSGIDSQNLSGYNLNLADKASMENVVSSAAQGTTMASWICPPDN